MLTGFLGDNVEWSIAIGAILVVLGIAWGVAHLAARAMRAALRRLLGEGAADVSLAAPIERMPIGIVWMVAFLLVVGALGVPALEVAGAEIRVGLNLETVTGWLLQSGLRVGLIVLIAYALLRLVSVVVRRFEMELGREQGTRGAERAKRAKTLGGMILNVVDTAVIGVALLMVLQELNVNIMPVLTGAGIVGLAVGFGAQTLVRDFISGFFMILEDQVRVGDVANIGGTGGLVEEIGLRTIVLRDLSGTVHIIPNGSVDKVSNLTKDFSYYVIDMGVAYQEDTDRVVEVMRAVADEMLVEPAYEPYMQGRLEVLGVDDFGDSQVTVKVRLKTVPLKQWEIGREYRRRVKKAFDAQGIEIPFPHLSVYFGEAGKPFPVRSQGD